MARFHYKAVTSSGEVMEGEVQGESEEEVLRRLHADGYLPIRAREISAQRPPRTAIRVERRSRRVTRGDLEGLTQELASLLHAGFAPDQALKVLAEASERSAVRQLLERVHAEVRGGASLSAAMEAQGPVFGALYLNMVRAGEAAGVLGVALQRMAEFMERSREVREAVSSALIYPLILVAVAVVSLAIVLGVVVPRFAEMFEDAGQALPWSTQVVMAVGAFFHRYWWLLVLALAGIGWYLRRQLRNPRTRTWWDARLLALPLVGELITGIETARFSRTLGTLLGNGVPLLTATGIAGELVGNRVISGGIERAADRVRQGQGLARPLLEERAMPQRAAQMLRVAEESGRLEEMLLRVADHYERQVQRSVRRLVGLLEPVLILGLGLVIGAVIMSIVVAILSVNQLGTL